ncbi:uncharacterized protein DSM5745_08846 [Aspergillus mulundensis]|uniref:Uncharacterized protein n=1 Tax=Aspergillus mulundensis TaxID=1810919 RepID=A0A3D8R522_9EURO|nr:Uncharacterized protein DSM5745_08846 [Aspergillus mulundensis]RDW69086.1 Uncharacterized protein DSM5745_08846 [Aspergillus mulundensis]
MAPRPELYPLQTPKHIIFPSELQEYLRPGNPEPARCNDGKGPSVPPPLAYTEFLKALSPAFGSPPESAKTLYSYNKQLPSPQSLPSTASTTSFPGDTAAAAPKTHKRTRSGPPTPLNVSRSAAESGQIRRLRMSPSYLYSPAALDSPKSAHAVRSPYPPVERRVRYTESLSGAASRSITIQHIVTHTVTLKRVPSLAPPPKGKRRRMNQGSQ